MDDKMIGVLKTYLSKEEAPWALFQHGTVVVLRSPGHDLAAQATDLLKEWGPVVIATPAGDFNVLKPSGIPGWIVTSHHDDIFTYVSPEEVGGQSASDLFVGLTGRTKRDQDASELVIAHVESQPGPKTLGAGSSPA